MLRVSHMIIGILGFLFASQIGSSRAASEFDVELQKIIDHCWALSQEQRDSGVTAVMAAGAYATEGCFQKNSIRLAQDLYKDPDDFKNYFADPLFKARETYFKLIEQLTEGHDHCVPSCGTTQMVVQSGRMAHFQQEIYETVFRMHWIYTRR